MRRAMAAADKPGYVAPMTRSSEKLYRDPRPPERRTLIGGCAALVVLATAIMIYSAVAPLL